MHTQVDSAREYAFVMGPLASLKWSHRFLEQTPGDKVVDGPSRQVPGACLVKSHALYSAQP